MVQKERHDERAIVIGGVYRHFKGDYYQVLTVGKDSETLEDKIVYTALYYKPDKESRVWVRTFDDFMGTKEMEDGTVVERFSLVSRR